jgi:glycerate-2-kinase
LLESGASIYEVNTVRIALSGVKGGQLLSYFNDVTLLDLVISDVPNDELESIGSGPTTSQEISFDKAFKVLKKYFIWNDLPHDVRNHLAQNMDEELREEKPFTTPDIKNHYSWIVSSASQVAEKVKKMVVKNGYQTKLIHPAWSGSIDEFEEHLMEKLQNLLQEKTTKKALVFYGESTVIVTGDGLGGRNQEIALRIAKRLNDYGQSITFLSAGTDGIDGPTDVSGAIVDQNTYKNAKEKGLNPEDFIDRNDSYHFFQKAGGHIKTGPTGNNVMDIQFFLIDD